MTSPHLSATSLSLSTAATSLAVGFLGHCLDDAVAGLPYDVDRVRELLLDDDVYFLAADRLVAPSRCRGWRALGADLDGLPEYRVAVLEHGCSGFFRNGFEVIFFGELALGPHGG